MKGRMTTKDMFDEFKRLYDAKHFRVLEDGRKTVEIQNAHFVADKDFIIREPSYKYAQNEIEWYESQSLNVYDIPGGAPKIWRECAGVDGKVNSNYGWCIFSEENGLQYKNCLYNLIHDNATRQAVMIYTRPSMQQEYNKNHMHDFMCTHYVHCFLNYDEQKTKYFLKYIVYQRSSDAVFGFNNDHQWHQYVQKMLASDLSTALDKPVFLDPIEYNMGSIHVYETHFDYLK